MPDSTGRRQASVPSPSVSTLHRSYSAHATTPQGPIYQDCNALTASPEKMQQDLKQELQGDESDLRSHVWYHGNIPRQRAEKLVQERGDYLVRDCVSQPGNFVVTCSWMGVALHFMINAKVVASPGRGPPRVFFQFEDVSCQSVQDLLQYYTDMKKPITETSGAIISNPIGRSMPLSYYDTKYGATANLSAKLGLQGTQTPSQSPKPSPFASPNRSPSGSPKLRRTPHRTGSQPMLSSIGKIGKSPSVSPLADQFGSSPSINTPPSCPRTEVTFPFHQRSGSEPLLTPTNDKHSFSYEEELEGKLTPASSDSNLNKAPPPKPSRVPSVKYMRKPQVEIRNKKLYEEEEDERDYTDYDTVKSKPSWVETYTKTQSAMAQLKDDLQKQNKTSYVVKNSKEENLYDNNVGMNRSEPIYEPLKERLDNNKNGSVEMRNSKDNDVNDKFYDSNFLRSRVLSMPSMDNDRSAFVQYFTSSLLPPENRPLDVNSMSKIKTLLLECNAKILARHLTQVDLEVAKVTDDNDLGMGVQSGLELITLPQGQQLRQDLMERSQCLQMFVSTMILTCTSILERARMLSQWITIAMELRTSMGNLYGFVAVMDGIMTTEIQRLRDTWLILRQNHTSSAFLFDTKLKSFYRSLQDGSAMLPVENITLPNILALVSLLERQSDTIMEVFPWEDSDDQFGLDILLTHLDTARFISRQFAVYRSMGEAIMKGFVCDQELRDIFSTPFHLNLLWGFRGAHVNRPDRYKKYQQLMMVLSERAERPGDHGTEL